MAAMSLGGALSDTAPCLSMVDLMNGTPRYAVFRGDFALGEDAPQRPNLPDLNLSKFGCWGGFSHQRGAVDNLVGFVLGACRPTKVTGSHAAKVAFAARVGDLMCRTRSRSINPLADNHVGRQFAAGGPKLRVAALVADERPQEAFIALMQQRSFDKSTGAPGRATRRAAGSRRPMTDQSRIVCGAQSSLVDRLAAVRDGTYTGCGHLGPLSQVRLSRARRWVPARRRVRISISACVLAQDMGGHP